MKKLMIILSAVAAAILAVGTARGDGQVFSGAGFEGFQAGAAFNADLDDNGGTSSETHYWYSASNDGNVISNYESGVTFPSLPDYFADAGSKYLYLDTSSPLFRSVNPNSNTQSSQNPAFEGASIGDGIYLDTLVQFTAADSAFSEDLTGGDKIAISYVEHESEGPGDDPYTNFVIRAGQFVNGALGQANYFAAVPQSFKKEDWHRLTVRTIGDVGDGSVGFVVYVDEDALSYTNDYSTGFETLNAVAQGFDTAKSLFPSAVQSGTDKTTISVASFSGTGAIDDVVFTQIKPQFIANSEQVMVTFTVDAGVAGLTVTADGIQPISVDMTANPIVCALPSGTTSFTLGVTLDPNGYTLKSVSGDDVTYNDVSGLVTLETVAPTIAVTTSRNNVTYIDANGDPQACVSLSEAFADAGDLTTITLAYDISVADTEDALTFAGYQTGSDTYVLDLAGHTINGGDDSAGAPLITVNGTLTIIDSVGGGEIIYDSQYGHFGILALNGSDAFIGDADGNVDAGVKYTGQLFYPDAEGTVVRGYFDVDSNSDGAAFAFTNYVDPSSACAADPVAGYWFVAPSGEEPPVTYAISWTLTGGTTTSVAGNFAENQTITFTADSGYELSYVSIDGTEIDGTSVYGASSYTYTVGTAGATLVVTFTQAAVTTYEVTITGAANATYTAKIGDQSIVTGDDVADGSVITIVATPETDYEYAEAPTGWTLSEGSITKDFTVNGEALTITIPDATAKQVVPPASDYKVVIDGSDVVISLSQQEIDQLAQGGLDTVEAVNAFLASEIGSTGVKVWEAMFLGLYPSADALNGFTVASIAMADGKVALTVPAGISLQTGRGVDIMLKVYGSDDLATWSAEPLVTATNTTTIPEITPAVGESKKFYKIVVDFAASVPLD